MIGEQYFYDWMIHKKGFQEELAKLNLSRVKRIDAVYDLFTACFQDEYAAVLSLLEYSEQDAELGLKPKHSIAVDGDIYSETRLLRSALELYIEAENDDDYCDKWMKSDSNTEEDREFEELMEGYRAMGSINDADVRKMLADLKDE